MDPVISRKTGHLYEKRLIEKYLQEEGRCPVTGEVMSADADLLALQVSRSVRPRSAASASVPGLLASLQNEWDDLALETFSLKQSLDSTRRDLSQALYQHDAACRVIARLMRERDEARALLQELQAKGFVNGGSSSGSSSSGNGGSKSGAGGRGGADDMEVAHDAGAQAMGRISALIVEKAQALSAGRRGRKPADTQTPRQALEGLKTTVVTTPHKASPAGVACIAVQQGGPLGDKVLTGGLDKVAILLDREGAVLSRLQGHTKKVTCVAFPPDRSQVSPLYTGSADATVKVWAAEQGGDYRAEVTFTAHSDEVSALSVHPIGSCLVSFSLDGSWALLDGKSGAVVRQVGATGTNREFEYLSGQVHPDGMLLGGGTSKGTLKVWDLREQINVGNLEGHGGGVESLCFSENGYYLASGDSRGSVRLWDLRKMKCAQTLEGESR